MYCPRCGTLIAVSESYCRKCGADVRRRRRGGHAGLDLPAYLVQVASLVFAGFMWVLARGSEWELLGGVFFVIIAATLAIYARRAAPYRVIKARRRARRALLKNRVVVLAPMGDPGNHVTVRIEGTVVFMDDTMRDEIVVRADSPVWTTANQHSDLLALTPVESGESFSPLVDLGRMPVALWLVNEVYLSVRRGSLFARRSLRENPTFSIGQGMAFVVNARVEP